MRLNIFELSEKPAFFEKAVHYFWSCWGNEGNFIFYQDCMRHSMNAENLLPKFYILLDHEKIIASYALLTNDIISRQDLMPWFACLFVNKDHRKKGIAAELLRHGLQQAKLKGFDHLYLSSDLVGFYEKNGWKHIAEGYNVFGGEIKIYAKKII
ncbi:MAG: GNAT family N-acetyltransferase [Bacteroidota bacterium]